MHPGKRLRKQIIKEKELELVHVFDTNEHEDHKDVTLVKNNSGRWMILRTGETRSSGQIFPNGYDGDHFKIPEIYEYSDKDDNEYELVEYIEGDLISSLDIDPKPSSIAPEDILKKIVNAFWEFQQVAESDLGKFSSKWEKDNLVDFFNKGKKVIDSELVKSAENVIKNNYNWFWNPTRPAKWKFAFDINIDTGRKDWFCRFSPIRNLLLGL